MNRKVHTRTFYNLNFVDSVIQPQMSFRKTAPSSSPSSDNNNKNNANNNNHNNNNSTLPTTNEDVLSPPFLPPHYYYTNKLGGVSFPAYNIANLLYQLPHVMQLLYQHKVLSLFTNIITILTLIVILFVRQIVDVYTWRLFLFLFVTLPPAVVALHYVQHYYGQFTSKLSVALFRPILSTLLYDFFYNKSTIVAFIAYNLQHSLLNRALLLLTTIKSYLLQTYVLTINFLLVIPVVVIGFIPIAAVMIAGTQVQPINLFLQQAAATATNNNNGMTTKLFENVALHLSVLEKDAEVLIMVVCCILPLTVSCFTAMANFSLYTPYINSMLRYVDIAEFLQIKRIVAINQLKYHIHDGVGSGNKNTNNNNNVNHK